MQFKQVKIEDKENIESITRSFDSYSDFNFVSLISWGVGDSSYYNIENNILFIKLKDYINNDKYIYSIMGGAGVSMAIKNFFSLHEGASLDLVPQEIAESLDDKLYNIEHVRDEDDYVYSIKNTLALEGPRYRKLRRSLSNFYTKNASRPVFTEVKDLDINTHKEILQFTKKWRSIRGRSFEESSSEYYAIRRALRLYKFLDIKIWTLVDDLNLLGFAITENYDKTAIIHFEKCDTTIPGMGSYLKYRIFEEMQRLGCDVLNYEQDLGLEGLRSQKMSLNPSHLLRKYTITRRS